MLFYIGPSNHHHHQSLAVSNSCTASKSKRVIHDDLMGQSVLSDVSIYNKSTVTSQPKQVRLFNGFLSVFNIFQLLFHYIPGLQHHDITSPPPE